MGARGVVVFDWDGTLVDSVPGIVASIREAAACCGLAVRDEQSVRDIIGLSLREAVARLYPDVVSEAVVTAMQQAYMQSYERRETEICVPFPGVCQGLDALREAGWQLAVATGKSRRGLDRALAHLGWAGRFKITRCADECRSKPAPDMLLSILDGLRLPAQQAFMVGDSEHDLGMARNAGVGALAVSYGAQSAGVLESLGPVYIAETFVQLQDWFLSQP